MNDLGFSVIVEREVLTFYNLFPIVKNGILLFVDNNGQIKAGFNQDVWNNLVTIFDFKSYGTNNFDVRKVIDRKNYFIKANVNVQVMDDQSLNISNEESVAGWRSFVVFEQDGVAFILVDLLEYEKPSSYYYIET